MGEKTAREVIENHSGGWLEGADGLIAALDAAGFVIASKTALEAIAQSEVILPTAYQYVAKIAKRELAAASTPTGEKG